MTMSLLAIVHLQAFPLNLAAPQRTQSFLHVFKLIPVLSCIEARKEYAREQVRALPVLGLVVHVDKDGGGGNGSHGGALVVKRVGGDEIRAQV